MCCFLDLYQQPRFAIHPDAVHLARADRPAPDIDLEEAIAAQVHAVRPTGERHIQPIVDDDASAGAACEAEDGGHEPSQGGGFEIAFADLDQIDAGLDRVSDLRQQTAVRVIWGRPRARELMARTTFLLPGVGAQGGRVEELAPAFVPGRAGGLITASRSIANAYQVDDREPAAAARAEAERLRGEAWALSDRAGAELPIA